MIIFDDLMVVATLIVVIVKLLRKAIRGLKYENSFCQIQGVHCGCFMKGFTYLSFLRRIGKPFNHKTI